MIKVEGIERKSNVRLLTMILENGLIKSQNDIIMLEGRDKEFIVKPDSGREIRHFGSKTRKQGGAKNWRKCKLDFWGKYFRASEYFF